jgi:hypothetical protein
MKPKPKREGSVRVPFEFDDAIRRALQVKPPVEGWTEDRRRPKQQPKRRSDQSDTARYALWIADKKLKRDAAALALAKETDPKKRRSLRAQRDRYQAMITMGPKGTSEASAKAAQTRG